MKKIMIFHKQSHWNHKSLNIFAMLKQWIIGMIFEG